jgi:DNA-binding transcriptional MocR family regulator
MVPVQYRPTGRSAKQISHSLESGIRDGRLLPGALLPTVRALAADLDVAPGTVATAYRLLRERGLVDSRGRLGTQVRLQPALSRSAVAPLAAGVVDLADGQPDPQLLPELVDPSSLRGRAAAPPVVVLPQLLDLGRARLGADGVPTSALTLTSGGLDALHRVLSAQLRPGDLVAVEDPGWPNALDLVAALGLRAHPLVLDDRGVLADSLRRALHAGAKAVIVTSRAQNPTGVSLGAPRAHELRAVLADHPHTLVVEDDHAGELSDVPLATLAASTHSWAFVRSTSKPYGPDLRVALVAGDETTVARVEGRMRAGSGWVSTLLQQLVVQLWTSPAAADAVAAAAAAYDARRSALVEALRRRGVAAMGESGLNVWVPVVDETVVVTSLLGRGWAVAPGARFRQVSRPAVRITVSGLAPARTDHLADDVAAALTARASGGYTT